MRGTRDKHNELLGGHGHAQRSPPRVRGAFRTHVMRKSTRPAAGGRSSHRVPQSTHVPRPRRVTCAMSCVSVRREQRPPRAPPRRARCSRQRRAWHLRGSIRPSAATHRAEPPSRPGHDHRRRCRRRDLGRLQALGPARDPEGRPHGRPRQSMCGQPLWLALPVEIAVQAPPQAIMPAVTTAAKRSGVCAVGGAIRPATVARSPRPATAG